MGRCPFWSNSKEKINCYDECPMNITNNKNEICPFKEFTSNESVISFSNSLNDDVFYSQDRYSSYKENDKVINY